jgi:hypothetical protein
MTAIAKELANFHCFFPEPLHFRLKTNKQKIPLNISSSVWPLTIDIKNKRRKNLHSTSFSLKQGTLEIEKPSANMNEEVITCLSVFRIAVSLSGYYYNLVF